MLIFLGIVFLGLSSCQALYSSGDVIELNESNFDKLVTKSDDLWVVEFYAPWCGHCKSFAPEYAKAATVLKGFAKVGAVNADDAKSLGGRFGVRGFPTVKIFGADKTKPIDFNGARTAEGVSNEAFTQIKSIVNSRLGGKSNKKSGSPDDVIELTDSNFDKLVLESDDLWLIEFFAPWCGHCKNLAPQWEKAASELKGKVKLGALDATVHTLKAKQYQVQGYPTIKWFPAGKKDKDSVENYQGGRTSDDIINFALDKLSETLPPPKIEQLTSDDKLKEACDKPLCIISFLPHILDCQADCRSSYIKTLQSLGDKFKKKMWGWVWSEAGAQPELEQALDVGGYGYPALAVLNSKKMKYTLLRGSFSFDGISEFLRDVSYGRGTTTATMKGEKLPKINKIDPWDGKDGVPPQDEDIDLSDVQLDDIKEEL